jgi:hypothetical protein
MGQAETLSETTRERSLPRSRRTVYRDYKRLPSLDLSSRGLFFLFGCAWR